MLIYDGLGFTGSLFGEIRTVQRKRATAVCRSPLPGREVPGF